MLSLKLYLLLVPLLIYLFIKTPIKTYKPNIWYYKTILLLINVISAAFSILKENHLVDKYLISLLIFLNFFILLFITLLNKYNYINLLPLAGIIYLLYTFNYKDFEVKNCILVNPNEKWIKNQVIILSLYYLLSNNSILGPYNKIGLTFLVILPLIFPIEYYFIHRIFILSLSVILGFYLNS